MKNKTELPHLTKYKDNSAYKMTPPSQFSNFWKIPAENAFNFVGDYKVTPFLRQ